MSILDKNKKEEEYYIIVEVEKELTTFTIGTISGTTRRMISSEFVKCFKNDKQKEIQMYLNEKKNIFFEDLFSHCINSCYLFKIIQKWFEL